MVKTVLLALLLGNAPGITATPSFLQRGPRDVVQVTSLVAYSTDVAIDPVFKLVNKTSIEKTETSKCLCPLGNFWHWRINKCVKQGAWGYECGFFPGEHHHRVCSDGLKCEAVQGAKDVYIYHGKFQGTSDSFPASCKRCGREDQCETGAKRHDEECLQEIGVTGKACATVRVTVPSIEATMEATADHTVTATADHSASKTATAKVGDGTATAKESATHKASESATATSSASATKKVESSAEATACVTIPEVKTELEVEKVEKVGPVLAQEIISKGDELAFERASKLALEQAHKQGLLDAQNAAYQAAQGMAAEKAKLEAERAAAKAAAWKAEAGANSKAQQAADARAKALADEQAKAAAAEAAAREAEAEAARKAAAEAKAEAERLAAEAAKAEAAAKAAEAATKAEAEAAAAKAEATAKAAEETSKQVQAQAKGAEDEAAVATAAAQGPVKEKMPPKEPDTKNTKRKVSDSEHAATLP